MPFFFFSLFVFGILAALTLLRFCFGRRASPIGLPPVALRFLALLPTEIRHVLDFSRFQNKGDGNICRVV
jgi:hypothetical protein